MKRCPYCAEDIDEGVVICPWCESDVTVDPDAGMGPTQGPAQGPVASPPAGPESAAGGPGGAGSVLRYTHSGERYVLGFGTDFFGVWDRSQPGGPLDRYPRTDEGWRQAWNRFSSMESRFVEVPHSAPPAGGSPVASDVAPLTSLARWVVGLLAIDAVMSLITAIARAGYVSRLHDFQDGMATAFDANRARDGVNAIAGLSLVVFVGTIVAWCIWQHRAQANAQLLGASDLRFTPAWAVGWWFIPFANLVVPAQAMAELWRASDPTVQGTAWRDRRLTPLLPVWWAVFLARVPLSWIAIAISSGETRSAASLIRAQNLGFAFDGVTFAAALLAIALVRQITARLEEKRSKATLAAPLAAAAW